MCVAISFLCKDDTPKCPSDVDALLYEGTALFNLITSNQSGMTISELPSTVSISNRAFNLSFYGTRSGVVSQKTNDMETLTYCVKSALHDCIGESTTYLLTLGNSPGASIAIKKVENSFLVCDSHSRNDIGLCSPDGKAVVLQISSLNHLHTYVEDLASSLSTDPNIPFEVTAVKITER